MALEEPRRDTHPYLAAVLRATTSEIARPRAAEGSAQPVRAANALGYSYAEVLAAGADDLVASAVERLGSLAAELRAQYPEDWDGAWPQQPGRHAWGDPRNVVDAPAGSA